jgi:hypothetical protein
MLKLQKLKYAGYNAVMIWGFEFRKPLRDNPGLENELGEHHYVKNSPTNIRDALYGDRTEATKTWYKIRGG